MDPFVNGQRATSRQATIAVEQEPGHRLDVLGRGPREGELRHLHRGDGLACDIGAHDLPDDAIEIAIREDLAATQRERRERRAGVDVAEEGIGWRRRQIRESQPPAPTCRVDGQRRPGARIHERDIRARRQHALVGQRRIRGQREIRRADRRAARIRLERRRRRRAEARENIRLDAEGWIELRPGEEVFGHRDGYRDASGMRARGRAVDPALHQGLCRRQHLQDAAELRIEGEEVALHEVARVGQRDALPGGRERLGQRGFNQCLPVQPHSGQEPRCVVAAMSSG